MNNRNADLVPWGVVFIVLSAIMFCSSSLTTFFSTMKKKKATARSLDLDGTDYPVDVQEAFDLGSEPRVLEMADETIRPIDYPYSGARLTR